MIELGRRKFLVVGSATALSPWLPRAFGADAPLSPISNHWGVAETKKLPLDEICVFRGRPGAAYNHHHQVVFDRGRLYVSWSDGIVGEDNPGQRMLFATSEDDGKSWSSEQQITPKPPEETSVFTAMGIRPYRDHLVAYYGHYAWTPLAYDENGQRYWPEEKYQGDSTKWLHRDIYTAVRISDDGGRAWGPPRRIIDGFVPNLRPSPTSSGRLIIPGNISFPYTDDPAGIHHWKRVGIPRLPKWTVDDPEGFLKACSARQDPINYCEASFFQTDDKKIHMMLRTAVFAHHHHNGLLAVTESMDNGQTWSEPMLTSYTDCSCRFQFGRLPDGRFYGLSCPDPKGGRNPLVLAISKDGVNFDRHYVLGDIKMAKPRMPGNDKGGAFGYPTCDIANNNMYIVYSRSKEDINFMRLPLSAIA